MLRGIYSVAGAMEAATQSQEMAAENLTHLATPGYRRQGTFFELNTDQISDPAPASRNIASVSSPRAYSNLEGGPLQQTGNPFDLALSGNAFFVLDGPNGPLYTRNGGFERNAAGDLQTRGSGYRLRGSGGPISVPADATEINVNADGVIFAKGAEIGRLRLASFDRPEEMRRVGTTMFAADDPKTPPPGEVRVEQGYREGSNVQPVKEMVAMVLGMRYYQAAEKAMSALSDAVAQNTRSQQ
jgi:flagellar basal-body rod protein FlgF